MLDMALVRGLVRVKAAIRPGPSLPPRSPLPPSFLPAIPPFLRLSLPPSSLALALPLSLSLAQFLLLADPVGIIIGEGWSEYLNPKPKTQNPKP
jgi:hypothetical protein